MLRSSLKRLAIAYGAMFALSAAIILGAVYFRAVDILDRQLRETVEEELQSLGARFDGLGTEAFIDLVRRRAAEDYVRGAVYLLTDPSLKRLGGNLTTWPLQGRPPGKWVEFALVAPGSIRCAVSSEGSRSPAKRLLSIMTVDSCVAANYSYCGAVPGALLVASTGL